MCDTNCIIVIFACWCCRYTEYCHLTAALHGDGGVVWARPAVKLCSLHHSHQLTTTTFIPSHDHLQHHLASFSSSSPPSARSSPASPWAGTAAACSAPTPPRPPAAAPPRAGATGRGGTWSKYFHWLARYFCWVVQLFLKVSNILTEAECFVAESRVVFPKLESVSKLIKISRSSSSAEYTVQYSTVQYSTDTEKLCSDIYKTVR